MAFMASTGITKTLRPISGTGTSQRRRSPHTLLLRKPVLTANSAMRAKCAGSLGKSRSCSSHVIGYGGRLHSGSIVMSGGSASNHGRPFSSRYGRAARCRIVRTTSRLRLIVVAQAPLAMRALTNGASVSSWI
ncbi:hypothetical protein [Pseudaquabacterium terrae]|uniref:hypothetical protein n=1 Tax=Pseudaquabacterium terrae TaxID=2732868 RepID=UPI00156427CD|nr:hypothetical protein [Aquabacterium terrae]